MLFKKQTQVNMLFIRLILALAAMSFISSISWAQSCSPADFSCVEPQAEKTDGLKHGLELPPQLFTEAPVVPQSILASEMPTQRPATLVPSGTVTWGAIAKDFNLSGSTGLGMTNNWLTPEEAAIAAIQLCQKNGGKNCYVDLTYSNTCLGIVLGDNDRPYWEIGITGDIAVQTAMVSCTKKSGRFCKAIYTGCSYPAP